MVPKKTMWTKITKQAVEQAVLWNKREELLQPHRAVVRLIRVVSATVACG